MMSDPHKQIERIANYMGLGVDGKMTDIIHIETNLGSASLVCQAMDEGDIDSTTCLHENHLQGGEIGKAKAMLGKDYGIVKKLLKEPLKYFGY